MKNKSGLLLIQRQRMLYQKLTEYFYNFARMTELPPIFTFTRSGSATFTGINGLLQTAAINEPRFDYLNGKALGIKLDSPSGNDDDLTIENTPVKLPLMNNVAGTIISRVKIASIKGSDQHLLSFTAASISDGFAIRQFRSTGVIRGNCRSGNVIQHSDSSNLQPPLNAYITVAVTWKAGEITIYDPYGKSIRTGLTLPSVELNTLTIGARKSDVEDMDGWVASIDPIGEWLDESTVRKKMFYAGDIAVLDLGQSLADALYNSKDGGGTDGIRAHDELAHAVLGGAAQCHSINGSTSASGLLKTSDPTNYWIDLTDESFGPSMLKAIAKCDAYNMPIKIIRFKQVSGDAGANLSDYLRAQEIIYTYFLNRYPSAAFLFSPPAGRTDALSAGSQQFYQDVREARRAIAANNPRIEMLPVDFDLPYIDQVHHTKAGDIKLGQRWARKTLKLLGKTVTGSVDGPSATSATYNGSEIIVNLQHDAGMDITPLLGIEGFVVTDGNGAVTLSSAVRLTGNQIKLTSAIPLVAPVTVFYGYRTLAGVNLANLVRDNSPQQMPLQDFKLTASVLGGGL